MATQLEIYNTALSQIGAASNVSSLTEKSAEARACNAAYPIARKAMLRGAPWSFASRYRLLTETEFQQPRWSHIYVYPTDCLVIRSMVANTDLSAGYWPYTTSWIIEKGLDVFPHPTGGNDTFEYAYSSGYRGTIRKPYEVISKPDGTGRLIGTDVDEAWAHYTADITNTEQFDEQFIEALAFLLASRIAMPITREPQLMSNMLTLYQASLGRAMASNLAERQEDAAIDSEFIRIRD